MTDLCVYLCTSPDLVSRRIAAREPMHAAELFADGLPVGQYGVLVRSDYDNAQLGLFEVEVKVDVRPLEVEER